jgi:HK97 gp10 family phage protein
VFKLAVKLQGDSRLIRQLSFLRQRVKTRIVKSAITSAASIALKAAKAKVPRRYGQLRRSLGKRAKAYRSGVFVVLVGPRTWFREKINGQWVNPTKYAHLVELGTVKAAPHPFIRPAFDETKGAMLEHAQAKLRAAILREALAA